MGMEPISTDLPTSGGAAGQGGCRSIPEWVSPSRERESKIYYNRFVVCILCVSASGV